MTLESETMSGTDNLIFQVDYPESRLVITALLLFGGCLEFDLLLKRLETRLLCHDRFRCRVARPFLNIGRARWEIDPDFNLRYHVQRVAFPVSGDIRPGDKKMLENLVADLSAAPIDYSRPPWQMHFIENIEGGKSALFARIHHCMADGISLVRLLNDLADGNPDETADIGKPEFSTWPPGEEIDLAQVLKKMEVAGKRAGKAAMQIARKFESGLSDPNLLLERSSSAGRTAISTLDFARNILLLPADRKTVFKGRCCSAGNSISWSDRLPLPPIKRIGKHFGATVNDVLLAMLTGALRRYLIAKGEQMDGPGIRVAIPVNFRPPEQSIDFGNELGAVMIVLPVSIYDTAERIRETGKRMKSLKESSDPDASYLMFNAAGMIPVTVARKAAELISEKVTGIMSNIPGPRQELYFAGARIENIMCWVPRFGDIGLGISVLSYDDAVCLGILTDTGRVSDPGSIVDAFEQEFRDMTDC